ncbi:Myb-like dna-binding protein, partial [Globisporangium splendens]
MAISADVKNQLFRQSSSSNEEKLIRLPQESDVSASSSPSAASEFSSNGKAWTREEHERFLEGLELFPSGPWKEVAAFVGTRTTRQTMTHAQKYREKIARRKRGLRGSCASQRATLQVRKEMIQQQTPVKAPAAANKTKTVKQVKQVQTSPTAVDSVVKSEQRMLEDPLDFDGCFMDLDYELLVNQQQAPSASPVTTNLSLDSTLLYSLASSSNDGSELAHQLSLSDEEMDLIMDSVFPSTVASSYSSSSLQNAFSFVC